MIAKRSDHVRYLRLRKPPLQNKEAGRMLRQASATFPMGWAGGVECSV